MLSKTSRVISSKARQPLGRRPKGKAISQSALVKRDSSGKLKLMVLKHAPLGEINLPFVASSANAPRCRRKQRSPPVGAKGNRRQIENRIKLA